MLQLQRPDPRGLSGTRKMKKIKYLLLCQIILLLLTPFQAALSQNDGLPKERMVRIAIEAFQKKGGNILERVIIFDVGNGRWRKKVKTLSQDIASKFGFLDVVDYQAICLAAKPNRRVNMPDVWIFLDRFTGEILCIYAE